MKAMIDIPDEMRAFLAKAEEITIISDGKNWWPCWTARLEEFQEECGDARRDNYSELCDHVPALFILDATVEQIRLFCEEAILEGASFLGIAYNGGIEECMDDATRLYEQRQAALNHDDDSDEYSSLL